MANFPFKNATFTTRAGISYPSIDYLKTYYTKINGSIMAIRPIAVGIFGPTSVTYSSCTLQMLALAANGNTYSLDMVGRVLFNTAEEAIEYEINSCNPPKINHKYLDGLLKLNGAHRIGYEIEAYTWNKERGVVAGTDCGFIFWADKDGEHIKIQKTTKDGRKIYLNKEDCVNDNVNVVSFSDEIPVPEGEYTVKREFTVRATSAEEAENLVNEAMSEIKIGK